MGGRWRSSPRARCSRCSCGRCRSARTASTRPRRTATAACLTGSDTSVRGQAPRSSAPTSRLVCDERRRELPASATPPAGGLGTAVPSGRGRGGDPRVRPDDRDRPLAGSTSDGRLEGMSKGRKADLTIARRELELVWARARKRSSASARSTTARCSGSERTSSTSSRLRTTARSRTASAIASASRSPSAETSRSAARSSSPTDRFAHYHLSGTTDAGRELKAGTLLVHAGAEWARERGCELLHLGGGNSGADSLFSPSRRASAARPTRTRSRPSSPTASATTRSSRAAPRSPSRPGRTSSPRTGRRRSGPFACDRVPGEVLGRAPAPRLAHPAPQLAVGEQPLDRDSQRGDVAGRHVDPGLAVHDEIEQAADRARDHRPAVRHRLQAGDAEALAARRARDDRRTRVQPRRAPSGGTNPSACGTRSRSGPSPATTSVHPLAPPRRARARPSPATAGPRRAPRADRPPPRPPPGASTPLGITAISRAPSARRLLGERRATAQTTTPRSPQHPAREPRRAARELDVRAPELHDERLPGRERHDPRRQPVRVDEIGVRAPPAAPPARSSRGTRHAAPTRHGCRAQVAQHAGAVRDPEVAEVRRRDHLHVDPRRPHALDRVGHEPPRRVVRVARIRRRQDDDLQSGASRRPKTTGSASASIVSA